MWLGCEYVSEKDTKIYELGNAMKFGKEAVCMEYSQWLSI